MRFSRDGTRLAIGGGSWYGFGGLVLVDLVKRDRTITKLGDIHEQGGTVSGVAFSADDRHVVAVARTAVARPAYAPHKPRL